MVCLLLFLLCLCRVAGRLLPLGLVVRLPWCLLVCLPLGLLVVPPAHLPLACRSHGEMIPPRAYLCLVHDYGPHSRVGVVPSSGILVLGVAFPNHVTQRTVRGGTGLVPSSGTYLLLGLCLWYVFETLRGSSHLRP